MSDNEARIDLRLPTEMEGEEMIRMFNKAWDSLSANEQAELRQEREDWLAVLASGRAQHGGAMRGA